MTDTIREAFEQWAGSEFRNEESYTASQYHSDLKSYRAGYRAGVASRDAEVGLVTEIASSCHWAEEGQAWAIPVDESLFDRLQQAAKRIALNISKGEG